MDIDVNFQMNSSHDYEDYSGVNCLPAHEAVFIPVLLYVALVLGLFGNGLVLVVLWLKRRSWSVTDTFVLNLAVADILLLITLPFWAVNAANGWTFGTGLCKTVAAIFKMNIYFGIVVWAVLSSWWRPLSWHGYSVVLVRQPLKKPEEHKKRRALRFILGLTGAFFLTWVPYNIALVVDPVGAGAEECGEGHRTATEMTLMATAAIGCLQCFLKPLLYLGLASVFRTRALEVARCVTANSQSNHKISVWDSGEEEEDDSPAKISLSQSKC
ncbi:hypothetical protein AALO_G00174110 [Alosa alosa]|uniref:G-protein coupled receptors family 1 profile domain-containing protein n=1 Tax=Alosa alosa TaxID=278164 RepID=A0AAV6G7L1_9TELE|nr:hypothetical protein AALO_G00174110 [Alosa alosa]